MTQEIAVIRIKGLTKIEAGMKETLERTRLRKKYVCVIMKESPETRIILNKIRSFVAYGKIDDSTLKELVTKRAQPASAENSNKKKVDVEKAFKEAKTGNYESIKPYFRLHPPIGGLKSSKKHYPKGILGEHGEEISKLIKRMI